MRRVWWSVCTAAAVIAAYAAYVSVGMRTSVEETAPPGFPRQQAVAAPSDLDSRPGADSSGTVQAAAGAEEPGTEGRQPASHVQVIPPVEIVIGDSVHLITAGTQSAADENVRLLIEPDGVGVVGGADPLDVIFDTEVPASRASPGNEARVVVDRDDIANDVPERASALTTVVTIEQ